MLPLATFDWAIRHAKISEPGRIACPVRHSAYGQAVQFHFLVNAHTHTHTHKLDKKLKLSLIYINGVKIKMILKEFKLTALLRITKHC